MDGPFPQTNNGDKMDGVACLDVEVAVVRVAVVVVVEDDVDALGEPGESHDGEQLHKQHHLLPRLLRMNLNCCV